MQEQLPRGTKVQLSIPYSFIFKRKEKIEEEKYLTPPHPTLSPPGARA